MFAAEQTLDPNFVMQLMLAASAIGNLIVLWVTLSGRNDTKKREVTFADEFARKEDLDRLRAEHAVQSARCQADKTAIADAGDARARRLHERIDTVQHNLENRLHAIPHEVVALLKNTKAIK